MDGSMYLIRYVIILLCARLGGQHVKLISAVIVGPPLARSPVIVFGGNSIAGWRLPLVDRLFYVQAKVLNGVHRVHRV